WTRPPEYRSGAERSSEPREAFAKRFGTRQQAEDDVCLAREVEEVARVDEHAVRVEEIEHELLLGADRGPAQHPGPAPPPLPAPPRRARPPPPPAGNVPRSTLAFSRIRAATRADAGPASRRRAGSASCTGVATERYASAIHSRRSSASARRSRGPSARIQPSF